MSCPDFYSAVQNDDKVVLVWLCKKKKRTLMKKMYAVALHCGSRHTIIIQTL